MESESAFHAFSVFLSRSPESEEQLLWLFCDLVSVQFVFAWTFKTQISAISFILAEEEQE